VAKKHQKDEPRKIRKKNWKRNRKKTAGNSAQEKRAMEGEEDYACSESGEHIEWTSKKKRRKNRKSLIAGMGSRPHKFLQCRGSRAGGRRPPVEQAIEILKAVP